MRKDRTFLPALGLIVAGVIAVASDVRAQTPQAGPKSIEIAGVRLGMPREEAVKALMANQPPFEVTERGLAQLKVPVLSADAFVWSMEFHAKRSEDARDAPYESMKLEFAPPPSESTVLTFRRYTSFSDKAKAHAPTGANFLEAVTKKFGPSASDIDRGEISGVQERTYVWTRAGALLTEQEYQQRWKHYMRACRVKSTGSALLGEGRINFRASEEDLGRPLVFDSCAIVATVSWSQDPNGVLKSFTIEISDRAGILAAFRKSAEVVEGAAKQQKKQEIDRATKNRTKL